MPPSLCILHAYSTASGGSLPPGAGTDHPGAGRGAGGAAAAPGGAAVRGATAGYDYVPETTGELTADPSEQGRHLKHYPMQIVSHRSV